MNRTLIYALTPLSLLAVLSASQPAPAQPPAEPPPDAAVITRHYEAGQKAAKRKQWPQARQSFLEAWKLRPHYQIAANLGRAELMVGAYRDAAEHLAFFLREAPAEVSAEDRAQAQQWLDEAKAKIGTIRVKVEPADAEVLLDGVALPAPLPPEVYVEPGKRVLEARREGRVSARRELELAAGQGEAVELVLAEVPPPAPPPKPAPPPEPAGGRSPVLIGVGIGTAVAAAATGTVLVLMGAGKMSERDKVCIASESNPCLPEVVSQWDGIERSRVDLLNVGTWALIGAGMVGAATVVYAVTGRSPAAVQPRAGRIQVQVAPGGVGVSGRW